MFSLKDYLGLIVDRFRAIFNTETEESGNEMIAVFEFKITERVLLQRLLRAVSEYREADLWDDKRVYRKDITIRNVLMEYLIKTAESFGYEVVHGNNFKNLEVRKCSKE